MTAQIHFYFRKMRVFGYLRPEYLELAEEHDFPVVSTIYRYLSGKFDSIYWPDYSQFRRLKLESKLRFFDIFSSYLTEIVSNKRDQK